MEHIDEIYAELSAVLKSRTTSEWLEVFSAADVPAMPMHSFTSLMKDPHMVATEFFESVQHPSEGAIRQMRVATTFSRSPAGAVRPAPLPNQDGYALMREAGLDDDEIETLRLQGAFGENAAPVSG